MYFDCHLWSLGQKQGSSMGPVSSCSHGSFPGQSRTWGKVQQEGLIKARKWKRPMEQKESTLDGAESRGLKKRRGRGARAGEPDTHTGVSPRLIGADSFCRSKVSGIIYAALTFTFRNVLLWWEIVFLHLSHDLIASYPEDDRQSSAGFLAGVLGLIFIIL